VSLRDDIIQRRLPVTDLNILEPMQQRFSPRVFSSAPIPQADFDVIFEAARLTPSGRNHQPWFFYTANNHTNAHEKLSACLPERNGWALTAPTLIICCYDPSEPKDGVNKWSQYDLGAAVMSLVLQATQMGYYCRQIGSFDMEKTKTDLSIPDPLVPFTLVAIGKIGDEQDYSSAPQEIIDKELESFSRKEKIWQMVTE
jgi:nitroreductase